METLQSVLRFVADFLLVIVIVLLWKLRCLALEHRRNAEELSRNAEELSRSLSRWHDSQNAMNDHILERLRRLEEEILQ